MSKAQNLKHRKHTWIKIPPGCTTTSKDMAGILRDGEDVDTGKQ